MRGFGHSKRLAPLLSIVPLLGPAATAHAGSRDPWLGLHRALRLTTLAAGAPCPVSSTHMVDQGRIGGAAGVGPVYPLPSTFSSDSRHPNLLAAKTLWTWPTNLRTHAVLVLVRGRRLDQPGTMQFQLGPGWA
jgi:hypothetical protein